MTLQELHSYFVSSIHSSSLIAHLNFFGPVLTVSFQHAQGIMAAHTMAAHTMAVAPSQRLNHNNGRRILVDRNQPLLRVERRAAHWAP